MRRPEATIQRAVFAHLRKRAMPNVFAWHTPNGGRRERIEGAIFKGLGVVAGVPDVVCIKDGLTYGLELKSERGAVSANQEAVLNAMHKAGAFVSITFGLDEALRQLEDWGILRGKA